MSDLRAPLVCSCCQDSSVLQETSPEPNLTEVLQRGQLDVHKMNWQIESIKRLIQDGVAMQYESQFYGTMQTVELVVC